MKKKVNVAMIGHRFMGKAHSNAWRQVHRFFDVPFEPVMKAICGRNEQEVKKAADTFGWEEHCVSRERLVERKDIDVIDICTPGDTHLPRPPIRDTPTSPHGGHRVTLLDTSIRSSTRWLIC